MRTLARVFLLAVLVLDAAFGAFFLVGSPLTIGAEPPDATAKDAGDDNGAKAAWDRETLTLLGQQLEKRSRELERREAEYEELMRGAEVLRQAGLQPGETPTPVEDQAATRRDAEANAAGLEAFQRLQQAYENMEPESAARALAELAGRDREAVVELLLGWRPRTSGAILDALTQVNPSLAADLSYEIWKRSGKAETIAAENGR